MKHPYILLTDDAHSLCIHFGGQIIPLTRGYAENTLMNALIGLRACGTDEAKRRSLASHLINHQTMPESKCNWCKLEGKTLAATQGRRRITQEEKDRAAAIAHKSGRVEVRRYPAGLSGAQIAARWARQESPQPKSFIPFNIKDLI